MNCFKLVSSLPKPTLTLKIPGRPGFLLYTQASPVINENHCLIVGEALAEQEKKLRNAQLKGWLSYETTFLKFDSNMNNFVFFRVTRISLKINKKIDELCKDRSFEGSLPCFEHV